MTRSRALSMSIVLASVGCASIAGVDFGEYREGTGPGPQLQCVPRETSRCLCELDEGVRTCDDQGKLGPCVCEAGAATRCGNRTVDEGEACDDGNRQSGDGCSATCVPDGRPAGVDACPGQEVVIGSGKSLTFELAGALIASSNDGGTCSSTGAPDRIIALKSTVTTRLRIDVTPQIPALVSYRAICGTPSSVIGCSVAGAGTPSSRIIDVTAGQPVFLFLQPLETSATATFRIEVSPA